MRPFLPLLLTFACQSDYEVVPEPVDVDPGDIAPCDFTRVDGTDFYAYDCNPVFTTTGEDWADSIGSTTFVVTDVVGHPFYQLWYMGSPAGAEYGDFGLGYAISAEGTEWQVSEGNPLLTEPVAVDAWDASNHDALVSVWDDRSQQYVLLYQGYNVDPWIGTWGLGVMTSPDGRSWTRSSANPVWDLNRPVGGVNSWCWPLGLTLAEAGAGYTGYIAGVSGTPFTNDDFDCEVYRLNASSTESWEPDTNVILQAGANGEWDDQGALGLAIAELDGTRYMFYVGFGGWTEMGGGIIATNSQFLGMAVAQGNTWVKEPGPIPISNTSEGVIGSVAANTVGERIHLWVTDEYDGVSGVGYFLFDPTRAAQEDGR